MDKARHILGMMIKRDIHYGTIYLSYIHYIRNLLYTYEMIGANLLDSPIFQKYTFLFGKGKNTKYDVTEYSYLVKKLIYLLQIIRLDLAFVIIA